MSTPVLFLRGAIAQQKSKLRWNLSQTRNLKTMTALMSGHRIEMDTFGKLIVLFNIDLQTIQEKFHRPQVNWKCLMKNIMVPKL